MCQNVFSSVPGGRRVAHAVLVGVLVSAAGSAYAGGRGPGKDDDHGRTSGMVGLQQRAQERAPAPHESAPAPVHTETRSAPAAMIRSAPTEAPRVVSRGPGAPIMQLRAPSDTPQSHVSIQPHEERQSAPAPRVTSPSPPP